MVVNLLNVDVLIRAVRKHPQTRMWLDAWRTIAERAVWQHLMDVRRDFPHADGVRGESGLVITVFNVGGNDYRLITSIAYRFGRVFVHDVLTHAEYSKGAWKKRL